MKFILLGINGSIGKTTLKVFETIKNGQATCKILRTSAVWHGMTYKEDKEDLVNSIRELVENGIYPKTLWK